MRRAAVAAAVASAAVILATANGRAAVGVALILWLAAAGRRAIRDDLKHERESHSVRGSE